MWIVVVEAPEALNGLRVLIVEVEAVEAPSEGISALGGADAGGRSAGHKLVAVPGGHQRGVHFVRVVEPDAAKRPRAAISAAHERRGHSPYAARESRNAPWRWVRG